MRISIKKYKLENEINIKIAHISDIHYSNDYKIKNLNKIKINIENLKPNYICITGDLIDEYDVIKTKEFIKFKKWLQELSEIALLIISIGNHEYTTKKTSNEIPNIEWLKELETNKLKVLNNKTYIDNEITFIGYNPDSKYYRKKIHKDNKKYNDELNKLTDKLKSKYNILLIHTPMFITENDNYKNLKNLNKINLILSGHTHGGLMPAFIPGNTGIISPKRKWFPKNVRGKLIIAGIPLIINSGITKLSKLSRLSKFNNIYSSTITEIIVNNKK